MDVLNSQRTFFRNMINTGDIYIASLQLPPCHELGVDRLFRSTLKCEILWVYVACIYIYSIYIYIVSGITTYVTCKGSKTYGSNIDTKIFKVKQMAKYSIPSPFRMNGDGDGDHPNLVASEPFCFLIHWTKHTKIKRPINPSLGYGFETQKW